MRDPREFSFLRSRVTWFGIMGMAFLLWAWVDSMQCVSGLTKGGLVFTNEAGALRFGRLGGGGGWLWFRIPYEGSSVFAPFEIRLGGTGQWLALPHWCLVPVYVSAWMGAICYRWRIHRRAMRLPYEAEAP